MHWLSAIFDDIVAVILPWAEQYGAGGLAVVALIDSSFFPMPQVADALVIGLTIAHPQLAFWYAAATTAGSVTGCYLLFLVGQRGGEAFLRSRFHERHIDRGLALIGQHGWLAVTVPSLLPPPTPFKLFVLLAGMSGLRPLTFVMAIAVGRGARYGAEAWLAYLYGEQAAAFLRERLPLALAVVAGGIVLGAFALMVWRRRRAV